MEESFCGRTGRQDSHQDVHKYDIRSEDIMKDFANTPSPASTNHYHCSSISAFVFATSLTNPTAFFLHSVNASNKLQTSNPGESSSPTTGNGHATAPPRPPCKHPRTTDSGLQEKRPRASARPATAQNSRLFGLCFGGFDVVAERFDLCGGGADESELL